MITKYSNASARYDELFTKATARLKELKVRNSDGNLYDGTNNVISTLEEYFSNLRNLIYGPEDAPLNPRDPADMEKIKEGYVFLKLPVDEPYFTIDANKREVTVPDVFKKNGISVLGDEVSEMLFFSIDRFYDATDLSQLNIAIYWTRATDPNRTVYSTPAFFSVVESDERTGDDKLIFGWPISSEITKEAGKISFSVRFFAKDQTVTDASDEFSLVYSLSTLPQTVFINAGLSYDIKSIDIDNRLDDILFTRLVNSPLGKADPPSMPMLIFAKARQGDSYLSSYEITNQITKDIDLAVLGYRPGAGSLTYAWFWKDEEGKISQMTDFESPLLTEDNYIYTENFIKAGEDKFIATYYYSDDGTWVNDIFTEGEFETAGPLYVKCAMYTLSESKVKPGTYFACPRNTLHGQSKTVSEESVPLYSWVVKGPDQPTITSTSWNDAPIIKMIDSTATLSITGDNLDGTSTYQWLYNGTITDIVDPETVDTFVELKQNVKTLPVYSEGYYKVKVINQRNGGIKNDESSTVLVLDNIKPIDFYAEVVGTNVTVHTAMRNLANYETIQYLWYENGDFNNAVEITSTNSRNYGSSFNGYCGVKVILTKGAETKEKMISFNN